MSLVTLQEIIDLVVMVTAIGFIFKDFVRVPKSDYDPLKAFSSRSFFSEGFRNALIVAAPAIVLHEAGHKIAALAYGLQATFHAAYTWLAFGVVLKLLNAPFFFVVPGFVSYSGHLTPLVNSIIAFSGPAINLALFLSATLALKQGWFRGKYAPLLVLTRQINIFLFIFNMLPIPGFDGFQVFSGLLSAFR